MFASLMFTYTFLSGSLINRSYKIASISPHMDLFGLSKMNAEYDCFSLFVKKNWYGVRSFLTTEFYKTVEPNTSMRDRMFQN
jgi:hypothetical protein